MIKKVLIFATGLATILMRKVAGLVVESFKRFWNNWQWLLALIALLYGIFLFYYQSTTSTPARLTECEKHLAEHIAKSDERFYKIESNQHNIDIALAELKVMLKDANDDLRIIKTSIVEKRQ